MKNRLAVYVLILFFALCQLGFAGIYVSYKSGSCQVDLKGDGKWKEAVIDMELGMSSVLRTGRDGELEMTIEQDTVSIGRESLVKVKDLSARLGEKKKVGVIGNVLKYTKLSSKGGASPGTTAIAGVRALKATGEEIEWFEEGETGTDVTVRLEEGKVLFLEGMYARAIHVLSGIVDSGEAAPIKGEVSFYLGTSLFHSLRYSEALTYLSQSLGDREAYYYDSALVHYSLTQFFLKNYQKAIEGFKLYSDSFPQGEMKPYAVFMIGKSYKESGDRQQAEMYFAEIQEKYRDSEVYDSALEEIKGL